MWPLIISTLGGIAVANAQRQRNPNEKKPIKTAIAIGIGGLFGYGIYKLVGKELKEAIQKSKNKKLYENEKEPNVALSYPPSQFISWADKIEDAFNVNWLDFTDEDAIYSIMRKLKTNNDWLELNKAYGLRLYYSIPDYPFGKDLNMVKTLQAELDTKEKNKVNSILKSKKIKYTI